MRELKCDDGVCRQICIYLLILSHLRLKRWFPVRTAQSQHPKVYVSLYLTRWNANSCYNASRTTYLMFEAFQILFQFQQLYWFLPLRSCLIKGCGKEQNINSASLMEVDKKLWIFFHVSSCEMLHFVISYMKQNQKRCPTYLSVGDTFLCKFWHFQMTVSCLSLPLDLITAKLGIL